MSHALVALAALGGYVAGRLHFALLRAQVRRLAGAGSPWRSAALPPLRLLISGSVLVAAALAGFPALAAALGGWMLARGLSIRAEQTA